MHSTTNRDKQDDGRDIWVLLFYQEESALLPSHKKTKPVFSLREPLLHLLLILLKRETLYRWERNSIFATEVTVLFVQHGFEILQTFQKPESQVSYLPSHLRWYVFDFEIELKILIFKWMSSNSHRGNISALFKIRKRLLGKDLKLSASFPIHCRFTAFSQQLLPPPRFLFLFIFYFLWFHCGAAVPTWSITKKYLKWI